MTKVSYRAIIWTCIAVLLIVVCTRVVYVGDAPQPVTLRQAAPLSLNSRTHELAAMRGASLSTVRSTPALDVAPDKTGSTYDESRTGSGQFPSASSDEDSVEVDYSVVGRPFPISMSIVARSKAYGDVGGQLSYAGLQHVMSLFDQEPREVPWASTMERQLRDTVMSESSGDATVRNVECRSTLCILESAAIHFEALSGETLYAAQRNSNMQGVAAWLGYEKDASGIPVYVVLTLYCRPPSRTYLPC